MLVALSLAIAIAAVAAPAVAFAGEPTSTPPATGTPATATTPVATPTISELRFDITDAAITWEPVPGATRYAIEATVLALRIDATDICEAPLERDSRELSIDEVVGGEVNERSFGLPEVAPDRWLVVRSQVQITAFNAASETIAIGGRGRVTETCMFRPDDPTPSPPRQLPSTGSGPETNTKTVLRAMIATAAATTLVLAGMYGIQRRIRVRDQ